MKLFRALLAIVVGLSLTLICQGHETTGKHSRPHVSLLGEISVSHEHSDTSLVASTPHSNHASQANHAHHPHEQEHLAPALSNATSGMPQPVEVIGSTMLDVAHGADNLSV